MKNLLKALNLKASFVVLLLCVLFIPLEAAFFKKTFSTFCQTVATEMASAEALLVDSRNCGPVNVGPDVAPCSGSTATIGGNVFEDTDFDGVDAGSSEVGVGGIIVKIYDNSGALVATTTTDNEGDYLFTGLTDAIYRVEFELPSAVQCWAKPSVSGVNNSTTVQFIAPGSCANLGITDLASFCGTKPLLATTCFLSGDPLGGGTSGIGDVLVSYPYENATPGDVSKVAINSQIGTAWGLAYDRVHQNFYTGAMLKRHAGFGPLGIDGIYRINYSDPTKPLIDNWLKLSDLGIDAGTDPRNYTLPADAAGSSADDQAFGQVGKIGIGDVDLSDDGSTLYVMNLNNNGSLVIIDVASKTLIDEIKINNPGCGSDSDVRPWAIDYYEGEVYIGLVCSGQATGVADLNFFVLKLNGNSFTQVFTESLSYPKGFVHYTYNLPAPPEICSSWEPWTDDFNELHTAGFSGPYPRWCRPQAILSDIEFDIDGSMILAFMDRTGHQTGYLQYDVAGAIRGNGYVGGDILRIHNNNGTFEMENAGTTSAGGGCGANGQGPGGGEYYCGEALVGFHEETSLGALALSVSDSLVALNVMDPTTIFTGGTAWLDNNTGDTARVLELYNSDVFGGGTPNVGTFGKAAGLGDLELVCEPAPIEIGNYVWEDLNANGIQDPLEKGIDGITVELVKNNVVVATTVTANGGQYYFSEDGATGQTWTKTGDKVLPKMDYIIRIATNQFSWKGVKLVRPKATLNSHLRDNDGIINGDYAEVSLTTGISGLYGARV